MCLDHLLELLCLLIIQNYSLLYVRQGKYLISGHGTTCIYKLLHELIVWYGEISESSKSGSRIHQESNKYPSLWILYLIDGKITWINLINSLHHIVKLRKSLSASIILIDYSSARWSYTTLPLVFTLKCQSLMLTWMMIEPKSATLNKWHICKAVILRNLNQSVLKILRMRKLPMINNSRFLQQCATRKSIKIRSCNQPHSKSSLVLNFSPVKPG